MPILTHELVERAISILRRMNQGIPDDETITTTEQLVVIASLLEATLARTRYPEKALCMFERIRAELREVKRIRAEPREET